MKKEWLPLKDPAILRMRFVSDGLSLEMMTVRRVVLVCSSPTVNSSVQRNNDFR